MRFTEARGLGEKAALAKIVVDWGYERVFEPMEVVESWWLRYGPAIAWLCPYDEDLQLHVCVDPEYRSGYARFFLTGIVVVAQLLGYERLVWFGVPDDLVSSYLRRMGWRDFDEGLAYNLNLEDTRHGKEA